MESDRVFNLHSYGAQSAICLPLSTISRNPPGSYKRHPRSVASISQQARYTGQITCPAKSNLRKSPVALGVIHVAWKPAKGIMGMISHPRDIQAEF